MILQPLATPRLFIREIQRSDCKALHSCSVDTHFEDNPIFAIPGTISLQFVKQALSEQKRHPRLRYELAILCQKKLVGAVSLRLTNGILPEADLGYIIHSKYRGQGYASEAAIAIVNFAFDQMNLFRITARCKMNNLPSVRILHKLGMVAVAAEEEKIIFAKLRPRKYFQSPLAKSSNYNTSP